MNDTKEKILTTALHLFASDGYEAVSVSEIAGALGMTKGALYKHYTCKRDIFDCIVKRMYEIDAARAGQYAVPEEKFSDSSEAYRHVSVGHIKEYTIAQLTFWTEDPFASDFRRMLTLEQYRNPEMAELYRNCITSGPLSYMEDIFREMMSEGRLRPGDARLLALEFYAPLCLLISISDAPLAPDEARRLLGAHIDSFFTLNIIQPSDKENKK